MSDSDWHARFIEFNVPDDIKISRNGVTCIFPEMSSVTVMVKGTFDFAMPIPGRVSNIIMEGPEV
jgi:hypothetical protein